MKILVPTSVTLDESRLGLEAEDTVVSYDPTVNIDAEHYDADVLISWANTNEQLKDAAAHLDRGPDVARRGLPHRVRRNH